MEDTEKRKNYLEYFKNETMMFDLEKFILDNDITIDNGAIGIITPNQILFVRNLPREGSIKPGSGNHYDTYDILTKVLYELPLDNRKFHRGSKELEYYVERNFDIKNGQNIFIRIINEGNGLIHMRGIFIELPIKITSSQLNFLKYLEEKYRILLKTIGGKMVNNGEDSLIYFQKKNREGIFCNSFLPVIEYVKENLIDDVKQIIEEKYIIGDTIEDINNMVKQI